MQSNIIKKNIKCWVGVCQNHFLPIIESMISNLSHSILEHIAQQMANTLPTSKGSLLGTGEAGAYNDFLVKTS
jgi:hypothetical protein